MATASITSIFNGALLLRYPALQDSPSTTALAKATSSNLWLAELRGARSASSRDTRVSKANSQRVTSTISVARRGPFRTG
jgi:hypothetical protein